MAITSLESSINVLNEEQAGHTIQYHGKTGLLNSSGKPIPPESQGVPQLPQERGAQAAYYQGLLGIAEAGRQTAALIRGNI